ncbi:MAG: hypothetical protein ABI690_05140 [Chloroflexota bacterium]
MRLIVSLPDANTVRRFYGVDSWVEDLIPSPNYQRGIFQGADSAFPRSRKVIQLWDGRVRTFALDQQLREPNVWSPDSRMVTFKTYRPILASGDTYIYDTVTMQQIYYQTHANFLTWLPQIP